MTDDVREHSDRLAPDMVEWRRHLHQNPELGFEVHDTAAFVEAHLKRLDLDVRAGLARTGVVGILRSTNPEGPAVLLRADMDALPIQEVEGRPYGSKVPDRMHACGHDGHTAMLLGAAAMLSERKDQLRRDVVFCFQPAEEGGGGGRYMVEDGVLDLVETGAVYALHLWSPLEVGQVHMRPGPAMAAVDEFRARIIGRGGHGALPHLTADPIVAAARAVDALQAIVSRDVDPMQPAVVTVGSLHAGSAPNVIPDEARLEGTMRSFADDVRQLLRRRVPEVLEHCAAVAGCRLEYEPIEGYPALVNDGPAVEVARQVAASVFGADNVHEPPPMACAEDFAYFLEQRPGAFILVGAGNQARGITAQHHTPRFDIDEAALPRGAELLVRLALHPQGVRSSISTFRKSSGIAGSGGGFSLR